MQIGDNIEVKVMGKVTKIELYADGTTRAVVANGKTQEFAIVIIKEKADGQE